MLHSMKNSAIDTQIYARVEIEPKYFDLPCKSSAAGKDLNGIHHIA